MGYRRLVLVVYVLEQLVAWASTQLFAREAARAEAAATGQRPLHEWAQRWRFVA